MKSLSHIFGASAILVLALTFTNCSTDSDVVQVSENELGAEDIVNPDDEADAKSSSAKKEEKVKSSSSKKSVQKDDDDDDDAADDDKAVSSSSSKAKSSSSAKKGEDKEDVKKDDSKKDGSSSSSKGKKIRVPGIDNQGTGKKDNSSSSSEEADSVVATPDSSSSEELGTTETEKDTISTDSTTVVSNNDNMDKLDEDEQKEIEDLISGGDTSFTQIDSGVIDQDSLDFENNEYLCKAPDGSWYRLKENRAKTFWKLVWDITVYIFTGHHYYDFTEVCDEIYMRAK